MLIDRAFRIPSFRSKVSGGAVRANRRVHPRSIPSALCSKLFKGFPLTPAPASPDSRFGLCEDDDFIMRIFYGEADTSPAPVRAVAVDIGDNSSTRGESLTVGGEGGFEVRFAEPVDGFVGFIAPFPITYLRFDEDAGGDDIAVRDFRFGARGEELVGGPGA